MTDWLAYLAGVILALAFGGWFGWSLCQQRTRALCGRCQRALKMDEWSPVDDDGAQALCDFCKQPLGHEEAVELSHYVLHPACAEEVKRRFWDWAMNDEGDCTTCIHLPVAPEGWHCARHRDAPADCGDWKGVE